MLQAHKVIAIEIKEIGCSFIGSKFILLKFQTHLLWVVIAGAWIVDGNGK